jgi:hypothetical protein
MSEVKNELMKKQNATNTKKKNLQWVKRGFI